MKFFKNNVSLLIILLVLILGVAGVTYFLQKEPTIKERVAPVPSEEKQENDKEKEIEGELAIERILDDELYSILIPAGWAQAAAAPPNFLAMVIKPKEKIGLDDLADIDYESYYVINNTVLDQETLDKYVDLLKQTLIIKNPTIEILNRYQKTIGGHDAIYVELQSFSGGQEYKTLLVFVDDEKWVWALSFNTLLDLWEENKEVFYGVAASFVIK